MIHYVRVVHVDPEREAALGKAVLWMLAAWLAWHFAPEGWSMLTGWLGGLWHTVTAPFVWFGNAVDGAFRVAATVEAVLLPLWALLAGWSMQRKGLAEGSLLWLAMAGLHALCAVLLGYPVLGGMMVVGSLAMVWAVQMVWCRTGWLALALVAGLSCWGMQRYGATFSPVCWPLVPASWACLALGATSGSRRLAGGWLPNRDAAKLLLLASVVAIAAAAPFAAYAARAAGLVPATLPTPAQAMPALAGKSAGLPEPAGTALPVRQPHTGNAPFRTAPAGKPAGLPQTKSSRT